jgi:hypothetical protein
LERGVGAPHPVVRRAANKVTGDVERFSATSATDDIAPALDGILVAFGAILARSPKKKVVGGN